MIRLRKTNEDFLNVIEEANSPLYNGNSDSEQATPLKPSEKKYTKGKSTMRPKRGTILHPVGVSKQRWLKLPN